MDGGYVTETQISEALARQLKIEYIDLQQYDTRPEIIAKLPEAQARRFRCAVLEDKGTSYLVGMVDLPIFLLTTKSYVFYVKILTLQSFKKVHYYN